MTNLKHGRYSKSLGVFSKAYQDSLNDPSLLDVKEPIALLDSALKQIAARVGEGDTVELRQRAYKLLRAYTWARENKPDGAEAHLNALEKLLKIGVKEDRALNKLITEADRLARRIEGAWSVKLAKKAAINAQDLVAIFARFIDIIKTEAGLPMAERVATRIEAEVLGKNRLN